MRRRVMPPRAPGLKLLGHEDAACAGRIAGNFPETPPAIAFIERGRLEADRVEDGRTADATAAFFLKHPQDVGAKTRAAQRLGQEEQVEEEKAQRRAPEGATRNLASRRILDDDGKRTSVANAGDIIVEAIQSPADRPFDRSVNYVRDGDSWLCHRNLAADLNTTGTPHPPH